MPLTPAQLKIERQLAVLHREELRLELASAYAYTAALEQALAEAAPL